MPESYKEDERPAQQWYWNDWFSAFDVRQCSLAARGLWIDMLGIMWKARPRGALIINEKPADSKMLSRVVNATKTETEKLLRELESENVFSRLEDGTIICRRVYFAALAEKTLSEKRAAAGRKGAGKRYGKSYGKPIAKLANGSRGHDNLMAKKTGVEDSKAMAKGMAKLATSTSSSTSSSKKECSEKHFELAVLLESKIKERLPRYKFAGKDYLKKWANVFRLMEEKEEATISEIEELIIWIYKDDFWYKNILSGEKLRKQFGRLWAEREDDKKKRGVQSDEEFDEAQDKAMEEKK